jgi:hypothetical protein
MNPFDTHGAISWPELMAIDAEAAADFYARVFGWSVESMPMESGEYHVASSGGVNRAGMMDRPSDEIPPSWNFYVTVRDVHAITERAIQMGASLEVPPMVVPGVGAFAGIADPQGAIIFVMQYEEMSAGGEPPPVADFLSFFATEGAFSWFQLLTPDPAASARFYADLFGWETEEQAQPMGPYHVVKIGEIGFGGITAPFTPDIPPHWQGYVTVDDADETAGRVVDAGGQILMPPTDVPGVGRMLALQDPQGAMLMAVAYIVPDA